MTKTICHLVLHYSIARLSWKTIKSLRKSRHRLRSKDDTTRTSAPLPPTIVHDNEVSTVEYEILKGWTLLAFHAIYVSVGIESVVRFIVPFYYHIKMIILVVTFVVPSWNAVKRRGDRRPSDFGLSPVISLWFDCFIVPGVHRMHELMNHDPKKWALEHLAMAPFVLVDFLILPGVLSSDEERSYARKTGTHESMMPESNGMDVDTTEGLKVPPSNAFLPPVASSSLSSVSSNEQERMHHDEDLDDITTKNTQFIQSPFARKYKGKMNAQRQLELSGNKDNQHSPPRQHKQSTLSTPGRTQSSLFSRTTPTLPSASKSTPNNSIGLHVSPVAKSRVASSALRLRRFSREHECFGTREAGDIVDLTTYTKDTKENSVLTPSASSKLSSTKNDAQPEQTQQSATPAPKKRSKRRERLSFGDHFRELVTGDAKIRVRDHLFDLDLPSVPVPSPRRNVKTNGVTCCNQKISSARLYCARRFK
jgi:hypothetical protein